MQNSTDSEKVWVVRNWGRDLGLDAMWVHTCNTQGKDPSARYLAKPTSFGWDIESVRDGNKGYTAFRGSFIPAKMETTKNFGDLM